MSGRAIEVEAIAWQELVEPIEIANVAGEQHVPLLESLEIEHGVVHFGALPSGHRYCSTDSPLSGLSSLLEHEQERGRRSAAALIPSPRERGEGQG
jgi:hypothetical protein